MPAAARLGDKAQIQADAHGCPACPHPGVGPIVVGSTDVLINGLPAARADNTDLGLHAACCGPNFFQCAKGSPTVYVNNKPLARMNDQTKHCGGNGKIIEGSPDVLIDDGADAQGLGSYAMQALQILLGQENAVAAGQAATASDTHDGEEGQGPAQDLASEGTGPEDKKSGSISSAGWSQARASNGQEVEIQIACKDGKGQLKVEIWARSSDPAQDKSVQKLEVAAGDEVKEKVKLDIPGDAAPSHECFFYYVVKDEQGGEKKSPMIYVDRAPFRFST
jgi:uncharacterized Zn-binding protein involved in type VI secretion